MYRRRITVHDRKMAERDENEVLNTQSCAEIADTNGMIEVKIGNDIEAEFNAGGTTVLTSADAANAADIPGRSERGVISSVVSAGAAVGACGNCMDKILMVVSTILGVMVIIGGGLLAYQGTVAVVGFNYVLWLFAGIEFVAGVYIIFRTFSLASTMAQLRKINGEFEETQEKLEDEVEKLSDEREKMRAEAEKMYDEVGKLQSANMELRETSAELQSTNTDLRDVNAQLQNTSADLSSQCKNMREVILELSSGTEVLKNRTNELGAQVDLLAGKNTAFAESIETYKHENANLHGQVNRFIAAGKDFETQVEALCHERTELALANDKLRNAISSLASANDASIDIGKMIAGVLEDMERERDGIKNEREAMERFSLQLSSAIFAEMDINSDGTIDKSEQSAWLTRIKK